MSPDRIQKKQDIGRSLTWCSAAIYLTCRHNQKNLCSFTRACGDGKSSEGKKAATLAAACMRREEVLGLPLFFLIALYESPGDPSSCIPGVLLALRCHCPDPKRECWHLLQQGVKVLLTHKQQFGIG